MMSRVAFGILLLAVSATAFSLRSNAEAESTLKALSKSSYGNSLLNTIALQMNSKAPIENVLSLLDNLEGDLHNQQKAHDELNQTNQGVCDRNIATFKSQIATANKNIEYNEQVLAHERPELSSTIDAIANKKADIAANENTQNKETETRKRQNEEYQVSMKDHDDALAAVSEAKTLVAKLRAEGSQASLLQINNRVTSLTQLSSKLMKSYHNSKSGFAQFYEPVISTLAQLAEKANPETVSRILDLLEKLRIALAESRQRDQDTETKQQADYDNYMNQLKEANQKMRTELASLEKHKVDTEFKIAEAESNVASNKADLAAAESNLANQIKTCEEQSADYARQTLERDEELELVDKVRVIFQTKLSTLSGYLKDRVNTDAGFSA
eukprot:GILI01000484.1.p1 GENE.GILI01000484.1~~GILI01000484.1.p1  ORF type:complete len:384 (-),score=169.03 GILI01000484.1:68-1219(-)